MVHSERSAIGCYRRRGAQPEPSTGREGTSALLLSFGREQQLLEPQLGAAGNSNRAPCPSPGKSP